MNLIDMIAQIISIRLMILMIIEGGSDWIKYWQQFTHLMP
ncbi:MAG: hypothetical protein ACJASQ_000535 [Crocinitomicaceae bacterium]|jgi:hypothetical protein